MNIFQRSDHTTKRSFSTKCGLSALAVLLLFAVTACRNEQVSSDSSLRLTFSVDTLRFDTVFTTVGSATKSVTIYNPNKNAVIIDAVTQDKGKYFFINVDGETQTDKMYAQINGGDSLIMFVKVHIDPQNENTPVLVEDAVRFAMNGNQFVLTLEAYGQDVVKIQSPTRCTTYEEYTFNNVKPYLIFDTVKVTQSLVMEPGARLYFHNGASLIAEGAVTIGGGLCISDRIDQLFEKVPYAYAAGGWDGFYIVHHEGGPSEYNINGLEVVSGINGLQLINADTLSQSASLPTCHLTNSRIHNHTGNGLTIRQMNAVVTNTEVSNCAEHCVYLMGGEHTFIHSTIASYFNSTNVRIQTIPNKGLSAVFVDNADSLPNVTASFINCIIDGLGNHNLMWADSLPQDYEGRIFGNYLKSDSVPTPLPPYSPTPNIYWQKSDTARVFVNTFFEYDVYTYYDFHLAQNSSARGIADSTVAVEYTLDRDGLPRDASHASAGCYEK